MSLLRHYKQNVILIYFFNILQCTRQNCLLAKYDMLKDGSPDIEKVKAFITKWSDENPSFKDAIEDAISKCVKEDLPGPPNACLANKIAGCMSFRLFLVS